MVDAPAPCHPLDVHKRHLESCFRNGKNNALSAVTVTFTLISFYVSNITPIFWPYLVNSEGKKNCKKENYFKQLHDATHRSKKQEETYPKLIQEKNNKIEAEIKNRN